MRLGQELKFKNKLCNLKLGTFFSALPGLGASALSGRVGTKWCSDAWGVWGLLVKQGVWGLLVKLECILLHASVCCRIFKWFNQLTQVAQSDYSSGSISEYSRLRNPVQPYP